MLDDGINSGGDFPDCVFTTAQIIRDKGAAVAEAIGDVQGVVGDAAIGFCFYVATSDICPGQAERCTDDALSAGGEDVQAVVVHAESFADTAVVVVFAIVVGKDIQGD